MAHRILSAGALVVVFASSVCAQTFVAKPTTQTATKMAPVAVEEPRDLVAKLYEIAIAELKKAKGVSPFYSHAVREKYFSKNFDVLITSAETKAAHAGDAVLAFDRQHHFAGTSLHRVS